jgi:hypothetical protein
MVTMPGFSPLRFAWGDGGVSCGKTSHFTRNNSGIWNPKIRDLPIVGGLEVRHITLNIKITKN